MLKEIRLTEDPFGVYERLRGKTPSVLLESARTSERTGRCSIVAAAPFLTMEAKGSRITLSEGRAARRFEGDPFQVLRGLLKEHAVVPPPGLPPFAGGAVGYLAYEAKNILERRLPQRAHDDLGLPDLYFLFFDEGILFDHGRGAVYLFSRTGKRLKNFERELRGRLRRPPPALRRAPGSGRLRIEASLSAAEFRNRVERAKRFIKAGDIFQANLSQRLSFPFRSDALRVYARLRRINPSSFFGFLDAGRFQILSGSPERLVKLERGLLETRPIAGTRFRGKDSAQDAELSQELLLNEKERAEHVMLVDLERNDLGRVSEYGSVSVDELMTVEDYSHVKHIVSNVRGVLKAGLDAVDVLKAVFPGGTITGAPKVRCMEIIDELEPVARGPYTGSMGYLSFTGNMDFNILIRSLVIKDGWAHCHTGAGIVADSKPEKEYHETLYKAAAVLSAVFGETRARRFFAGRGLGGPAARIH